MPVNSTSTGASYGKSSDPLCPLGFHPQVRWPTRCKRCFRDYKEHYDANDRAKFGNTSSNQDQSWANGQRPGFSKSKSLDVNLLETSRVAEAAKKFEKDDSDIPRPSIQHALLQQHPQQAQQGFGRFFEGKKNSLAPKDQEFQGLPKVDTEKLKAQAMTRLSPFTQGASGGESPKPFARSRTPVNAEEVNNLRKELESLREEHEALKKEHYRQPINYELNKATETAIELSKARERISEKEQAVSALQKEKKSLQLRLKEMESRLDQQPPASQAHRNISEYESKLKFLEKKCKTLEAENEKLHGNVQNLESELEEIQDNFREDEADEYRNLKRDLENTSKNCRVLQFKLKKAEKNLGEVTAEKIDLENKMREMSGGSNVLENINKVKKLEHELERKTQLIQTYETQLVDLRRSRTKSSGASGPALTKTGSVDKSAEDQLLKDLQDAMERENDLKEQMSIAEEESTELRVKVSRLEDENESLMHQLKKMSSKAKQQRNNRRSPSPYGVNRKVSGEKISEANEDEGEGEETSVEELRLQLEVSESEAALLRKKVDSLLTDNLKLTKEIKDVTSQLNSKSRNKSSSSGWRNSDSSLDELQRMEELQTELNATRIKLIEKERECESLESQMKSQKQSKSYKVRNGASASESDKMKLEVIEKEAEVLRQRNAELEAENQRLCQKGPNRKLPALSMEKFQSDKKALEEKLRQAESDLREKQRIIENLRGASMDPTASSRPAPSENTELAKLKKEKNALEIEIEVLRKDLNTEKNKSQKLEQDVQNETSKVEKARVDSSVLQREKKTLETENQNLTSELTKLRNDIKALEKERDKLTRECEALRSKNTSYLQQTQDGVRAFKEQIESLKKELQEEKLKSKKSKSTARETEKLENRISELEEKWAKSKRINQQRKEKIEDLEKQIAEFTDDEAMSMSRLSAADKTIDSLRFKIQSLEKQLSDHNKNGGESYWEKEYKTLKNDHATIQAELTTLRQTYNAKADDWIKEKLEIQRRMNDLEDSLKKAAGEGWESERERFKQIIEDRDSQIIQLKIECDVARSQAFNLRKEVEDLKFKLADYEKMSKFQKVVSNDDEETNVLKEQVNELKKQLSVEKKDKKSEINLIKMKHDTKVALLTEELASLKAQASKYRRERDTLKEMVEGVQKSKSGTTLHKGDSEKDKVSELQYQIQVLEDELSEAKLETSKANAKQIAAQSNYEIQIAELQSKINELEEEALIETGRSRIAGSRTKMELAWQKERENQKKLINELNTMARDLKSTLIDVEREKDRERLEFKRKSEAAKSAYESELEDTRKQVADLHYDLFELRDAHAKLRTTNEKLRKDKEKVEKESQELRAFAQDRSRSEQSEDKKVTRLLSEIDNFASIVKKSIGEGANGQGLESAMNKLKESKEELEQFRRLLEEERANKRSTLSRRAGSTETEGSGESPATFSRFKSSTSTQQRRLNYRKTASFGEGASDAWKSQEQNNGSTTSLASNASIPLPIPVRTSNRDLSSNPDSGFHSIRRLERDTSLDRLSTGSKDSMRSTQSELVGGRKKSGLISKLKKLTRGLSAERDQIREKHFGSGSDISIGGASHQSGTLPRSSSRLSAASKKDSTGSNPQKTGGSRSTEIPSRGRSTVAPSKLANSVHKNQNRKTSAPANTSSPSSEPVAKGSTAKKKALFETGSNPNDPFEKYFQKR